MSIQFAGSKSLDDRRRRRLVANTDDLGADEAVAEEGPSGAGLISELVASEAAGPWVPAYEWRIWTYTTILGLLVLAAAFAICTPTAFRPELAPLTRHLLHGPRPLLAVVIQSTFLLLSAQLAILIGWYRSQCKIDFRGYYRIWPWATALFGITAICSVTNIHGLLGEILQASSVQLWRINVISWLLPAVSFAVPVVRLLDLDVRRSRSSHYTLRLAWLLAFASACLELFAADLKTIPWVDQTRIILPMVASAMLFTGLWLHARIVAYVCPDPPEPAERSSLVNLRAGWRWLATWILRPRAVPDAMPDESATEEEVKPKRGRRKTAATTEEEDATATKKKRRAPAKRASKPRTRTKSSEAEAGIEDAEQEQYEDQSELTYETEPADTSVGYDSATEGSEAESTDWNEEPEVEVPMKVPVSTKATGTSAPASKQPSLQPEEPEQDGANEEEEESGDTILRRDSGLSADQFKGLSKRQKRELRRQAREQQRNQRQ